MTDLARLVQLHDLDLLLEQVDDPAAVARLERLGFALTGTAALRRQRQRLMASLDRRWQTLYERARQRYGRAVVGVKARVCQGCFITLPTSAQPAPGAAMMCESCGRVLAWSLPA